MSEKTAELRRKEALLRQQLGRYRERIEFVKALKQRLRKEFEQGWVSEEDYKQRLAEQLQGVSSKKLLIYYGQQINEHLRRIEECRHQLGLEEAKKKQQRTSLDLTKALGLIAILAILLPALLFLKPQVTGLIVGEQGADIYVIEKVLDLNLTISESQSLGLQLNESVDIKSIKATGRLNGSGSARVYIEDSNGTRRLIYDSQR